MGEKGFGRLAVGLAAEDAAAIGGADGERHRPFAGRAVTDAGGFGDDLIEAGVDVVGELDLRDGAKAVGRHADGGADDAALGYGRVEDAGLAIYLLKAGGGAEDADEITDIPAPHAGVGVAPHHHRSEEHTPELQSLMRISSA